MKTSNTDGSRLRRRYPWWTRAIVFAFVTTIAMSLLFAGTGYPGEHWPMATGLMGIVLFLANLASNAALLAVAKGLRAQRNAVYSRNNLDLATEQAKVASARGLVVTVTLMLIAFNIAAVWGASLLILNWLLPFVELPALAPSVYSAGAILFFSGTGCLTAVIALTFAGCLLLDRLSQNAKPAPLPLRMAFTTINAAAMLRQRNLPDIASLPVQRA